MKEIAGLLLLKYIADARPAPSPWADKMRLSETCTFRQAERYLSARLKRSSPAFGELREWATRMGL